jgi:hypothetical protein
VSFLSCVVLCRGFEGAYIVEHVRAGASMRMEARSVSERGFEGVYCQDIRV